MPFDHATCADVDRFIEIVAETDNVERAARAVGRSTSWGMRLLTEWEEGAAGRMICGGVADGNGQQPEVSHKTHSQSLLNRTQVGSRR